MCKVFYGETYIEYMLRSIYDHVDSIFISLSTKPWNGPIVPGDSTKELIRRFPDPYQKIRVRETDWRVTEKGDQTNELLELNAAVRFIRTNLPDMTHVLYIDYDEIYHPRHLEELKYQVRMNPDVVAFYSSWRCHWKSFHWWIDPPEPSRPLVVFKMLPDILLPGPSVREVNHGGKILVLPFEKCHMHHMSYALPTEQVERKLRSFSHSHEIVPGWIENVWKAWDQNREIGNLNPAYPDHYKRAVRADDDEIPSVLRRHPFWGKDII